MKTMRRYLILLLGLLFITSITGGCTKKPSGSGAGEITGQETQSSTQEPREETPEPTVYDPRADFISGAKQLLTTDIVALLTEERDGNRFVGMLSDLLYDLNNRTAKTTLNLSVSDIIIDGEASENTAFLSLGLLHDADTGDSSLDLSLGLGTENAKSAGVYITDGTAVLKSGSTENKILLYPMPEAPGAGNTFLDQASILLTGLLSEDGAAYTFDRNRSDRMELCARYLDPWLEDTSLEEYSEEEITMKLAGKDVPLRSVTLSMSGQRAYDFVLGNMLALSGDVQFADMDALLAGLVNFLSDDLYNLIQSVVSDGEELSDYIESATGKLVDELQALTPEEISAAKFIVSILFNGDRPIGINMRLPRQTKRLFSMRFCTETALSMRFA